MCVVTAIASRCRLVNDDEAIYQAVIQKGAGLLSLRTRLAWFTIPKYLLLFDFVGALATSLSTGLLLTTIIPTGLPIWILCIPSIAAAGFALFDVIAYCYWPNACWPLTIVGLLNFLYCVVALVTSWLYLPFVTAIGMMDFSVECAIVIPIAVLELVVARHCRHR
jgi:hypothetical protein